MSAPRVVRTFETSDEVHRPRHFEDFPLPTAINPLTFSLRLALALQRESYNGPPFMSVSNRVAVVFENEHPRG